jgi:hypothetical protein
MKIYWLMVLGIVLANGLAAFLLFRRGGGPEAVVWWVLLIIPILVACLIGAGIFYHVVVRPGRW